MQSFHSSKIHLYQYFILCVLLCFPCNVKAQFSNKVSDQKEQHSIFSDILWFKSEIDSLARVDVYCLVPYQALQFTPVPLGFQGMYELIISIKDDYGKKWFEKKIDKSLFAEKYEQSRGANAEFDYNQHISMLPKGNYSITIIVKDALGKSDYRHEKKIEIPQLSWDDSKQSTYQMSSIMFASSIEEKTDGKILITPHVSDNIADLSDGFFLFYELYHHGNPSNDTLAMFYEIYNNDKVVLKSEPIMYSAGTSKVQQIYMPVKQALSLKALDYTIQLYAKESKNGVIADNILATTRRSLSIEKTINGIVYTDLEKAIKQLRFVALQADIDIIKSSKDPDEQKRLFDEFWKNLDPTPSSSRNEAFEEYYERIEFANKNFRSYTDGWMTDMGMVYIILGPPFQTDKTPRSSDGRSYARWIYQDNRQFTFVDNSGFDDFRLTNPFPSGTKYRYKGN